MPRKRTKTARRSEMTRCVDVLKTTVGDKVSHPLGDRPSGYITLTADRIWLLFVDPARKPPATPALTDSTTWAKGPGSKRGPGLWAFRSRTTRSRAAANSSRVIPVAMISAIMTSLNRPRTPTTSSSDNSAIYSLSTRVEYSRNELRGEFIQPAVPWAQESPHPISRYQIAYWQTTLIPPFRAAGRGAGAQSPTQREATMIRQFEIRWSDLGYFGRLVCWSA
jgi:hypothetical protein